VGKPKDQQAQAGKKFEPSGKYEPIEPDDPLLAKLGGQWLGRCLMDGRRPFGSNTPTRRPSDRSGT
jgi:hypothetical protein